MFVYKHTEKLEHVKKKSSLLFKKNINFTDKELQNSQD